jgi:hypothetical protein
MQSLWSSAMPLIVERFERFERLERLDPPTKKSSARARVLRDFREK